MVQVLPYIPSFGEKLIDKLAEAGTNISQGLMQRNANQALSSMLNKAQTSGENPIQGKSPLQMLQLYKTAETALGKDSAKVLVDQLTNQQTLAAKEGIEIRKEDRAIANAGSKDFFERVESDRLKLPEEELASDMILDAIKGGEIDPWSNAHLADIARSFGAPDSLANLLETPGSKEFKTARKTFIGNTIKDAFRGTTTKVEINLAEDMLAEVGVSKEGNLASAWGLQASTAIRKERLRLADELREKGVSASKIPATIDKMMQPYIKEVKSEYFEALKSLKKKNDGK